MDVVSNKYEIRHKWLMFSLFFMSVVVGAGWFATGYLGDMARQEIVKENEATITLLSTHLTDELKKLAGAAKAMSGSPWIPPALISGNDQDIARANSALDRYNSAMGASVSYLMDSAGTTIASSNRNDPDSFVGKSYQFRPYFTQAISGNAGRYFALGVTSLKRGFYASYPVRDDKGAIVGVVTMKKDLDDIEANLSGDSYFFFTNPQGIIFLSNKKEMLFKSLWPMSKETERALLASKQFGNKPFEAVLSQETADGTDITLNGKYYLVSRRVIDPEGWSIVLMNPTDRIFLYRSIGVIVTLLICTFILIPLIVNYKTARSAEHYRTLFNEILDGICLADAETGIIIDCNQALAALVCRERAELIGRPQTILHQPQDDKEVFSSTFKQHLTDKQEQLLETHVITKTGDIREVEIKANFMNLQGRKVLQGIFHDITEHKQAEEALRESEQRLHSIVDGSPIPAFVIGNDHRVIHWNKALEEMSRIKSEEIVGTRQQWKAFYNEERPCMADLLVDEAVELVPQWYSGKYIKSPLIKGAYEATDFFPALGEEGKWLRFTAAAIRDSKRMLIGAVETLEDMTEYKRVEEELRESEELFRSYLENAPDGVYMNDLEGTFLYGNRKCEEIIGYRREELIGKNFLELNILSENSLDKAVQLVQANMEGKSTGPDEIDLINKEGRLMPVEITTSVVQRKDQRIVLSFARDITERKQAEEALRESEQRFMDVLYSSPDAVLLIDGEKFVDCNEATARMLGYADRNEFLKTHPSELSPPTQPDGRSSFEKANEMMRAALEKGFHQFEWEHRRANGEDFPVEVSLISIVHHGKNVIHCMWRELTERKQAEQKLQNTLDSLRKAVGTTIQVMVSAVETRDPYTAGHQLRSSELASAIATEMGLPHEKIDGIRMAGSIHDIGKLSIPAEILSKPTKLSEIEFSLIKEHSRSGYEMLKYVESPWPLAEIVYQHHERMDGSGYPRNLKGEEIIMEARIMTVADVVEAMASHRPYRPGLGIDAALEEIEKNKGTFYDNAVADACLRLFREKGFKLTGA
jgi:PAS domain S-box-containing protein